MTGTWASGWATGDIEVAAEFKKGIGNIFDSTLGGSAANVDVTSISATYAHLLIVTYARSDAALPGVVSNMQFNGDTAANYDSQQLSGTAATPGSAETFAATSLRIGAMPANTAGANLFSASVSFIPHYAGTSNNKVVFSMTGYKQGTTSGSLVNYLFAAFWRSNAAINRVTLIPATGNFVTGTRVSVYGMGA